MIINVKHISRSSFKRMNFYSPSDAPSKHSHAYISIYGNEPNELPKPRINHLRWYDGIQLQFDDVSIEYPEDSLVPISKNQAIEIVNFVTKIHELPQQIILIVHCLAGVSRSAAVAKFVNENFDLGLPAYQGLGVFNKTVFRALSDAFHATTFHHSV